MKTEPNLWVVEEFVEGEWMPWNLCLHNRGLATERMREWREWDRKHGFRNRYRIAKYKRAPR